MGRFKGEPKGQPPVWGVLHTQLALEDRDKTLTTLKTKEKEFDKQARKLNHARPKWVQVLFWGGDRFGIAKRKSASLFLLLFCFSFLFSFSGGPPKQDSSVENTGPEEINHAHGWLGETKQLRMLLTPD